MAIDAGDHGNVSLLLQDIAVARHAMAYFTPHLCVKVLLVTEENELGQLIYANPGKLLAFFLQLSQFLNRRTCLHHGLMASHTFRHAWDLHIFAVLR